MVGWLLASWLALFEEEGLESLAGAHRDQVFFFCEAGCDRWYIYTGKPSAWHQCPLAASCCFFVLRVCVCVCVCVCAIFSPFSSSMLRTYLGIAAQIRPACRRLTTTFSNVHDLGSGSKQGYTYANPQKSTLRLLRNAGQFAVVLMRWQSGRNQPLGGRVGIVSMWHGPTGPDQTRPGNN